MGRELRRRGVTREVMKASGVYTEPVYYALRELDSTEVTVINPADAKALKGHKTDAKDAIRLLDLYECGLLSGSCIPDPDLREVRGGAGPREVDARYLRVHGRSIRVTKSAGRYRVPANSAGAVPGVFDLLGGGPLQLTAAPPVPRSS
jgi:hypothetical protein